MSAAGASAPLWFGSCLDQGHAAFAPAQREGETMKATDLLTQQHKKAKALLSMPVLWLLPPFWSLLYWLLARPESATCSPTF